MKRKKKNQPRWPQDKRSTFPNITGGMPIKMTRNQIPPVRMAILTNQQIINVGESWEKREPPCMVSGSGHWQQPLERTASSCQEKKKKTFQKTKPRILTSHM